MKQNNFDFLRFYFAFVVVIGHLIIISGLESFKKLGPYFNTYTSVTAFFCISGFLIAQSYINTKSLKHYIIKRVARLLPAYIFVIVFSALILSTLSRYSFIEYFTHPFLYKYLIANLSFLNFIQPDLPGVFSGKNITSDVNGALWTLKVEVCFYIIVPFIIYFAQKFKRKYIFFIIIYIFAVLYKNFFEHLSSVYNNNLYAMIARQLPGFLSYFISGIALFYYFKKFIKNKNILFVAGLVIYLTELKLNLEIFTPVALSLLVFTVAFSVKQFNSFAKYGDISYGIYIFHCPTIKIITSFGYFDNYNPILVSICTIIIIIITGFVSWHVLEKHFLKKVHSLRIQTANK